MKMAEKNEKINTHADKLFQGKIILASASPRRTELLQQAGIPHEVIPSECEEVISSSIPQEVVMELSAQKAQDVFETYKNKQNSVEDFLVIGADTVVAVDDSILGKPKSEEDAFRMLQLLQGKNHQVYTGVTLLYYQNGVKREQTFFECSQVNCYPISEEEIWIYIKTGEPMDKAGAYGIQGRFAIHIKGIEGDYNNIVGLPVARIYQELKRGI